MNLSLPTKAKFHFMIGYLRQAGKGDGLPAEACAALAEKLETAPTVQALQADLKRALDND